MKSTTRNTQMATTQKQKKKQTNKRIKFHLIGNHRVGATASETHLLNRLLYKSFLFFVFSCWARFLPFGAWQPPANYFLKKSSIYVHHSIRIASFCVFGYWPIIASSVQAPAGYVIVYKRCNNNQTRLFWLNVTLYSHSLYGWVLTA
jgi:hypothetical protein